MFDVDEQWNDLKGTAQSVVSAVKTGYQVIDWLKNLNPQQIQELAVSDPSFQFTGQVTDLRFFSEHQVMSMDMITGIQDAELRYAVQDEFNRAARSGLIEIDPRTRTIAMTDQGKTYIAQPTFQQAAQQHLSSTAQQLQTSMTENMGFPLTGSINDLQFFNHAESLDLSVVLSSPNSEVAGKVLQGFQQLQKEGKVAIDGLKVTLTESGKQFLSSPMMQAAASSVKIVPTGEAISTAIIASVKAVATGLKTGVNTVQSLGAISSR